MPRMKSHDETFVRYCQMASYLFFPNRPILFIVPYTQLINWRFVRDKIPQTRLFNIFGPNFYIDYGDMIVFSISVMASIWRPLHLQNYNSYFWNQHEILYNYIYVVVLGNFVSNKPPFSELWHYKIFSSSLVKKLDHLSKLNDLKFLIMKWWNIF